VIGPAGLPQDIVNKLNAAFYEALKRPDIAPRLRDQGIEVDHDARPAGRIRHGGPAINDLLGGHIQMMFGNFTSIVPHVRAGAVRPLAVTVGRSGNTGERLPAPLAPRSVSSRALASISAFGGSVNAAIGLFTKALSDRGVRDGVRALAIHPGSFQTERLDARVRAHMAEHGLSFEDARESMRKAHNIARFGKPEELATLIAMLASDSIEFLQGSIIVMDGGQHRTV
jgi:hypothetical protein